MLELDASLFFIFAIVWILLVVLNKVFFKPIGRVRKERTKLIGDDQEASTLAKEKQERMLQQIEAKIQEARAEAHAIRDQLEEEAQKEKERLVKAVSEESKHLVDKAKSDLEVKMKELQEELEGKSEELARSIEQRLLH